MTEDEIKNEAIAELGLVPEYEFQYQLEPTSRHRSTDDVVRAMERIAFATGRSLDEVRRDCQVQARFVSTPLVISIEDLPEPKPVVAGAPASPFGVSSIVGGSVHMAADPPSSAKPGDIWINSTSGPAGGVYKYNGSGDWQKFNT